MSEIQKKPQHDQPDPPGTMGTKLLFDRLETAQMLNISTVTLYREMRGRRISYRRIGDKPLFTKQDIEEYVESKKRCAKR